MCHVKETILETIALQRVGSLEKPLINKYKGCQCLEKSGIQGELRDFKGVKDFHNKIHTNLEDLSENYKGLSVFHFAWLQHCIFLSQVLQNSNFLFEVFYLHLIQLSLI